jgi:hypothetical protein
MSRLNLELQESDPRFSLIGQDRVHPKELGGFVMAYLFLKAQGVPQFVDDILENANGRSEFTFTRTAKALPFPVPVECAEALTIVPFMDELNQERLRVAGLSAGRYQLAIDDQPLGSFTAEELSNGVNLATFPNTPQNLQARAVENLDARRYELVQGLRTIDYYERTINPNFGTDEPFDWQTAIANLPPPVGEWATNLRETYVEYKSREAEVRLEKEALVAEIRETSQPLPHRFSLRKE